MAPDDASETRADARRRLAACFAENGIDNPDLDARLLVCGATGIDHAGLILAPDVPLGNAAIVLADLASRRLSGAPVSRLLGQREFWGLPFVLTPAVLDPRPETEGLVASLLDATGGRRPDALGILDLGVGSGAILAALLTELPGAWGIGVDRSEAACRVARRNLHALGLADRSAILCANWDDALAARFDIVASNPPYVAQPSLAGLMREVRDHDPMSALDGGDDGLDAYRTIAPRLQDLLRPGGVVGFECGAGQGAQVAALMGANGLADSTVYLDLAGHDRVVTGSVPIAR